MEGSRRRGSYKREQTASGHRTRGGRRSAQSIRLRKRQRLMRKILVWILCLAVMAGIAFGVSRVAGSFHISRKKQLRAEGIEKLQAGDPSGALTSL